MKAIEIEGLTKLYRGKPALDGLSLSVEPGEAVALIGPNGAGKTTLLRILATLLKPDRGHARVLGYDGRFQGSQVRRVLGYMPDQAGMEDDLSVEEYLEFFAGIHGLEGAAKTACVKGLVDLLGLGDVLPKPCGGLSRGMQQRVGLARTLVHNPSVLLLDEPAANLDPRARIELREVLKELRRMGKTILVSSHILAELGSFCTKLLLMDHGRILFYGSTADVSARLGAGKRVLVRVGGDPARLRERLAAEAGVQEVVDVDAGAIRVKLREGHRDYSFVVRHVVQEGFDLLGLQEEEPGLEEIFLALTARTEEAP